MSRVRTIRLGAVPGKPVARFCFSDVAAGPDGCAWVFEVPARGFLVASCAAIWRRLPFAFRDQAAAEGYTPASFGRYLAAFYHGTFRDGEPPLMCVFTMNGHPGARMLPPDGAAAWRAGMAEVLEEIDRRGATQPAAKAPRRCRLTCAPSRATEARARGVYALPAPAEAR